MTSSEIAPWGLVKQAHLVQVLIGYIYIHRFQKLGPKI